MEHQSVALDFPTIRIIVVPTPSGRKWRATFEGAVLCTSSSPLVISARTLLAKGHDASHIVEMWHANATAWALRGSLGSVAAVILDGERNAQGPAKNGPPVRLNVPRQHDCPATSRHGGRDA
jgi:hypothetical protein